MIVDTLSVIFISAIIPLVILSVMFNPFFRRPKICERNIDIPNDEHQPSLTVLVLALNDADALAAHLPHIVSQNYPHDKFEIVVVGQKGDLKTESTLLQFADKCRLTTTFIPKRSLFMSKPKLAVALGVKAAHNDWIVLIDERCQPESNNWLSSMASHMSEDKHLVIGYSNFDEEAKSYYRFDKLRTKCYLLRKANKSIAYRSAGPNIAFRQADFNDGDGYRDNLQYVNGEYDFIINKYAQKGNTAIAVEREAKLIEDAPSHKQWSNTNIFYIHARKSLHRSLSQRLLFDVDLTFMFANYLIIGVAILFASLSERWILLTLAIVALAATYIIRALIANKAYKEYGENMSAWLAPFYELSIPWHQLIIKIRYAMSDKYEFTTHKL